MIIGIGTDIIDTRRIKKTITNDVINERPVLKVKYLNTFKKENWSTRLENKLYSINSSFF